MRGAAGKFTQLDSFGQRFSAKRDNEAKSQKLGKKA